MKKFFDDDLSLSDLRSYFKIKSMSKEDKNKTMAYFFATVVAMLLVVGVVVAFVRWRNCYLCDDLLDADFDDFDDLDECSEDDSL